MTDRLTQCFAKLKQEGRAGLVTFTMAGDPSLATSLEILNALPEAGADIIELGMPFSDPVADGKTIQEAGIRSLAHGTTLKDILTMAEAFREKHPDTPLILMGYYNPIYRYGVEAFARDAVKVGVDGVILVDLPPEEEEEFRCEAGPRGLHIIRLLTPTSNDERLPLLLEKASGFAYYIAVAGITGSQSADYDALATRIAHLREHSPVPIAVGFGIKTPEQVRQVAAYADAVVVGSALVAVIAQEKTAGAAAGFVRELADAIRQPQKAAG